MKAKKLTRWIGRVMAGTMALVLTLGMGLQPVKVEAKNSRLTGKTATEIVEMLGVGINIGNSLDATGGSGINCYTQEISWGNAILSQTLFDSIAAEGFTMVRIPVTWYPNISDDGTYTIREDFLARVKEVVDYAYNAGLFVILNTMHEDFTEEAGLVTDLEAHAEELCAVWQQLADAFADYDQHLIFESMNEPRNGDQWTGYAQANAAINYMNQVFVNTVRCNGKGYNNERCLMIQGYAASGDASSLRGISLPTYRGEVCNNLIISTHSYTPYSLCLTDDDSTFDEADAKAIDTVYAGIKEYFLDYGIPVVMGETGCTNTMDNTEERTAWAAYFASKSASYGVPLCLWENGSNGLTGGENHAYVNRETGEWYSKYECIVEAFINGFKDTEWRSALTDEDEEEGGTREITYYANGGIYQIGSSYPADPSYDNLTFEGWYTTPDYQEGTKLDITKVSGKVNAYAKYTLDPSVYGLEDNGSTGTAVRPLPIVVFVVMAVIAVVAIVVARTRRKKAAAGTSEPSGANAGEKIEG